MKTLVVNMLAGPGAGKSTTAAGVFSLLKLHNVNVELVTEAAKDFTWEKRFKTLDNQYYVWAKQQHRLWRIKDEVDVIVTDSPLFFSLIYGNAGDTDFHKLVVNELNLYNNINYFINRTKPYQGKGRNQTEEEARELDVTIKTKLDKYNLEYIDVTGDTVGINIITNNILEKLGMEPKFYMGKY